MDRPAHGAPPGPWLVPRPSESEQSTALLGRAAMDRPADASAAPSAAPASIAAGAPVAQNQDQVVYVAGTGNGLAVTALVCGIVGAVVGLIPILAIPALALGLVAFVLGILGRRKAKKDPRAGRKGAATAGIILGVIAIALGIAGLVIVNDAVNDLDRSLSSHCLNHPNAPDCP